jgi:hypothetical protein
MKERAPAFQFYPRQFAGDDRVQAMDLDAIGAHILLMCCAAASPEGYRIDADEYAIRMRTRNPSDEAWQRIKRQLLAGAWKVSSDGKWWIQEGLQRTFQKQKKFSDEQRSRANTRWVNNDAENIPESCRTDAAVSAEPMPEVCSSSSSSSSSSNLKTKGAMLEASQTDAGGMPDGGEFNSTAVARAVCGENGWSGLRMIEALKTAVEFKAHEMPECSLEQVGEWLARSFFDHKAAHGKFAGVPLTYFQQAKYPHSKRKSGTAALPVNDPAAYALAQMEGD